MKREKASSLRNNLKHIALLLLLGPWMTLMAMESDWHMEPMEPDLQDLPSLQNGWRLYVNYCLGCHSLQYQRYERTADDLGVPHEIALEQVVFTGQKIGEQMTTAMQPDLAKQWFGAPPPDLTMVARLRGPEWIYNYLKTFYLDDTRPFGVNNKVFPNVGMPNVLLELQGVQREDCVEMAKSGERDPLTGSAVTARRCDQLAVEEGTGMYTAEEFDKAVYDIANFLYYVGEPSRLERHRTGVFVLLFIVILFVFTYLLGREYQKDVKH
jgi:ubiquinol-cytochrome c reductase cytochrome c1 subunit